MKKLFKTAVNFMALAITAVATFGLAACEDIKKLELSLNVYNYTDSAFYAEKDVKFSVDLYRHLAPKTVDKVLEYVKNGYYDNAVFYEESGMIMLGDLKLDENGNVVQNLIDGKLPSEIYGEFDSNGTKGSDLVNKKGSIGIWRSYYASDTETYKTSSNARNSGRATWYIPTSEKTAYDGYFCVFAQYDTADTANAKAIEAITAIFAADYYTEYVIYYTGEYDAEKADENYGLTFNVMTKKDFDALDEEPEMFKAEKEQLVCFNKKTVKIPNVAGGEVSAKVKSVKVK